MEKLIFTVVLLGWSMAAVAQQQPPGGQADRVSTYTRDDPYIICAKNHPTDIQRFSHCDLKGEWHAEGRVN